MRRGESYPEPPAACPKCGSEMRQVGYDPNYCGAELIEQECTNPKCGELTTTEGKKRWTAGRV